jgi:hypothetical protein
LHHSISDDHPATQQNGEASEQAQLKARFRALADLVNWLATDNHPAVDELEHLASDDEGMELRKLLAHNLVTAHGRLDQWVHDKRFSGMADELARTGSLSSPGKAA